MPEAATPNLRHTADFVDAVRAIAAEASALLLRMQQGVAVEIKPDGSPVTEADKRSNDLIVGALRNLTPHIPVMAEENDAEGNAAIFQDGGHFWSVDPLDVTNNYIQGGDGFSINIALLEHWVPVFGLLAFPGKSETYYTGTDGQAYLQRAHLDPNPLHVRPFDPRDAAFNPRDVLSVAMRERGNEDALGTRQHSIRTLVTTGQHRAMLVARGEALMSSEAAGFRLWDSAPTFAILRAAGGECRQNDGQPLNFRNSLGLPEYTVGHATLLDRILPAV